jgi:hypothetical protein
MQHVIKCWIPNDTNEKEVIKQYFTDNFNDEVEYSFDCIALKRRPKRGVFYDDITFPWKRCTIMVEVAD